jgi:glycosyltransferase involved in cell wall biosynthesis
VRQAKRVDAEIGAVPRGGTHVFVGVEFDCAAWIHRADAERVIVFCQSASPTRYLQQLRAMARDGARPVDLAFPSQAMADRFGPGHTVLPPPIDPGRTEEFPHEPYEARLAHVSPAWPIGIVGQNPRFVREPPDADFVNGLASITSRLHIFDPGRIRYLLGGSPSARFFERRPAGFEPFLAQLACFVHRAETWWQDTIGRELYGAMAMGVPVLCSRRSIHAERFEHGVDGLVYGSSEEALELLSDLREQPTKAAAIGRAGRNKVRALLDGVAQKRDYRAFVAGSGRPGVTVARSELARSRG